MPVTSPIWNFSENISSSISWGWGESSFSEYLLPFFRHCFKGVFPFETKVSLKSKQVYICSDLFMLKGLKFREFYTSYVHIF